jgi:DNA polymerase-3 subunit delta
MDHSIVLNKIAQGNFEKVYLLQGEEALYIDLICDAIIEAALQEHERDFNQTIVYGRDADPGSLMAELRSYPLMAERRLVVLKEAQDMKSIVDLEPYFDNPTDTTIFVICHKYGTVDSRKTVFKKVAKVALVFKSEKVQEYKLADWIMRQVKADGYGITEKAGILLADSLGNDLSRIVNELRKLYILVEKGTTLNDIHIEENIGISKDYNFFELSNAIASRNVVKAFEIVDYFVHNPKAGPLIPIITNLFSLHKKVMMIHFLENKSRESVVSALKVAPFVANQYIQASRIYSPKKLAANIHLLHEYDLRSKGVNNSSFEDGELMKELVYQLMH